MELHSHQGLSIIFLWITAIYAERNDTCVVGSTSDSWTQVFENEEMEKCRVKLDHSQQYCVVANSKERDCLVHQAYQFNGVKCQHIRPQAAHETDCQYVEVCVFSAPRNVSDLCSYDCSVKGFDTVSCCKGDSAFTMGCQMAFVHCPLNLSCPAFMDGSIIMKLFQEGGDCSEQMEKHLSRDESWYWINSAHYENRSYPWGHLRRIHVSPTAPLNESGTCKIVESNEIKSQIPWVLSVVVVVAFVIVVSLCFGGKKCWKYFKVPDPNKDPDCPIFKEMNTIFKSEMFTEVSLSCEEAVENPVPVEADYKALANGDGGDSTQLLGEDTSGFESGPSSSGSNDTLVGGNESGGEGCSSNPEYNNMGVEAVSNSVEQLMPGASGAAPVVRDTTYANDAPPDVGYNIK